MSLAVHILRELEAGALAHLQAQLDSTVTLTFGGTVPEPAAYEILVAGRPRRDQITASPVLRALIIPFAGVPQETKALMVDFPHIAIHNLHHNALPAAEMAVTLMLAAAKFIVPSDRALRRHDWRPRYRPNPVITLAGKTVLILGYGAIGQRVAHLCHGLEMKVIATRRRVSQRSSPEVYPPETLPRLLPRANVLIIALPLTAETQGLIGRSELALLPARSVLVNVGRGPIVDEGALFHALRDGSLHAAGLDVWYNYPDESTRSNTPPASYPFHQLDNVVMSPHRAGSGGVEETELRRMAHLARLLNTAAAGGEMPNRVDIDAGY